jgi:hypothetical protein
MGKKSKKAKTNKLPKTIAGVKVPKDLRDVGGLIGRLARDPAAREVALAALTAALAVRKDNRKAARNAAGEAGEAAGKAGKAVSWMGPALTAAALEGGRMLLDAYENKRTSSEKATGRRDGDSSKAGDADGKQLKKAGPGEDLTPGVTH